MSNDFLPFGVAGGANVISQATYAGLAARLSGFVSGVAISAQLNKTWRQSSVMSSMLGEFIQDYGALDALDDGDVDKLEREFVRTLQRATWLLGAATGTANAWVLTPVPAVAVYDVSRPMIVLIPATNTSTTVNANVSGLGNRRVKKSNGSDPAIGDLVAGTMIWCADDGTNIRVLSQLSSDIVAATPIVGRTQIFTASGTFTVPVGVTQVEVEVIGAGGAGGASGDGSGGGVAGNMGAGGGGGGYGYKRISGLTPGSTVTVTVGSGGVPGTGTSGTGGTSSFGGHVSCAGGAGGVSGVSSTSNGGAGGAVTGADLSVAGGAGGFSGPNSGSVSTSDIFRIYGRGGQASGGLSVVPTGGSGGAGQGYGAGGTGASGGSLVLGGAGAPGIVIVRW